MKKWAEIARTPSRDRFNALSEFLNQKNISNEVHFIEAEPVGFEEILAQTQKEYDYIRIGSPFGESASQCFHRVPADMSLLKSLDTLINDNGFWVMKSALLEGFCRILNEIGSELNREASILVVGAGAGARVAISAFSKLGFKRFKISNKFDEQALELIKDLRKTYFDITFEYVPQDQLILLPGSCGILVNTTPLTVSNDLLEELYYFNFLESSGVVFDFTVHPLEPPLYLEAQTLGIHFIRGFEIASWSDVIWAQWCFGEEMNRSEYAEFLKETLKKVPFDMTPFKKGS